MPRFSSSPLWAAFSHRTLCGVRFRAPRLLFPKNLARIAPCDFRGSRYIIRGRGFNPAHNKKTKGKSFRLFVVEVTGLEPASSLSAAFSHRTLCGVRFRAPRLLFPKNLARIAPCDFRGSRYIIRGRGFNPAHNKKTKGKSFRLFVVEVTGLEPTTSWSLTKRATKLRYTSISVYPIYRRPFHDLLALVAALGRFLALPDRASLAFALGSSSPQKSRSLRSLRFLRAPIAARCQTALHLDTAIPCTAIFMPQNSIIYYT